MSIPKGMFELDGRSDSDGAGGSSTGQSITGDDCHVQGVVCATGAWNRQPSVSALAMQSSAQPVLAQENLLLGRAELFEELHFKV